MAFRLFTAIDLEEKIKDNISAFADECRRIQAESVKVVGREELHITLKFLGDVPEETAAALSEELGKLRFGPAIIGLKGAGFFPNAVFPKVLWVGVRHDGILEDIFRAVDETAARYGIAGETRRFHAHVTIARLKGAARKELTDMIRNCDRDFGGMTAGSFSLVRSELTPVKPVYTRLKNYPLAF